SFKSFDRFHDRDGGDPATILLSQPVGIFGVGAHGPPESVLRSPVGLRGRADQKQVSPPAELSIELARQRPRVNLTTRQSKVYDDRRLFGRGGDDYFRVEDCAGRVIRQTQ